MNIISITQNIVGWIATIILVITLIPQTIQVIKTKKTAGISPIAYSIAFTAMAFFILWGAFQGNTIGIKISVIQVFVANFISCLLALIIMFYIYKNIKKMIYFYLAFAFFLVVLAVSLGAYFIKVNNELIAFNSIKIVGNFYLSDIVFILAGGLIAFAFAPQTVITVKNKDAKNISLGTSIALSMTNIFWAIFYILSLALNNWKLEGNISFAIGVVISTLVFLWQVPLLVVKAENIAQEKQIKKEKR